MGEYALSLGASWWRPGFPELRLDSLGGGESGNGGRITGATAPRCSRSAQETCATVPLRDLSNAAWNDAAKRLHERDREVRGSRGTLVSVPSSCWIEVDGFDNRLAEQVAERFALAAAPGLLLLAPRTGPQSIVIETAGAAVRLCMPGLYDAPRMQQLMPFLAVALVRFLDVEGETLAVNSSTIYPTLVARQSSAERYLVRQYRPDGSPVLLEGRLTQLRGQIAAGDEVVLTAQEALTLLYLNVEPYLSRLIDPGTQLAAKRMILGEEPLPIDEEHWPTGPKPPVMWITQGTVTEAPGFIQGAHQGMEPRTAAAVRSNSLGSRPMIAMLLPSQKLFPQHDYIARQLASNRSFDLVLCPWYRIEIHSGRAVVSGHIYRVEQDRIVHSYVDEEMRVEAIIFLDSGDTAAHMEGVAGSSMYEHRAVDRLVNSGHILPGVDRYDAVDALLLQASIQGIPTNARGADKHWTSKHDLEFLLRAYTRATGKHVPRPLTYVTPRGQVGEAVRAHWRQRRPAVIKPAYGYEGRGVQIVAPEAEWSLMSAESTYAVQELAPQPLLTNGRKTEARAYVLVNSYDRSQSRWINPIVVRRADYAYKEGEDATEIVNVAYQRVMPRIPLEYASGITDLQKDQIRWRAKEIAANFLDAYSQWADCMDRAYLGQALRRVNIWDLDFHIMDTGSGLNLLLLECGRPGLIEGFARADRALSQMLSAEFVPALLSLRDGDLRSGVTT